MSCSNRHRVAGLYDLGATLGEGHFATVKLANHVFTGEQVAVKVIDKQKLDAATQVQMMQEVQLMKLVQHPYVVRLYDVINTATKLYLVLEFADGGDMYDYIMKHEQGLDEAMARRYFRQIVAAIQYCHRLHVVHRDLKPENVVFFEKLGIVKLTDFGFSNHFNPGQPLQTSCGSLAYSAPEILLGDAYDAPAVDVWSLGVILYMLVCGTAPFQEANDSETLTMIMDCKYTFPKHITQGCRRLISSMLQRQPDNRATLDEIVRDTWLGVDDSSEDAVPENLQLPLVAREHLNEEEHLAILKKMVAGQIASKDEILEALEYNDYNNVTATYFLLAEQILRHQRQHLAQHLLTKEQDQKEEQSHIDTIKGSPSLPSLQSTSKSVTRDIPGGMKLGLPCDSSTLNSLLSPHAARSFPRSALSSASAMIAEEDEEAEEDEDNESDTRQSNTLRVLHSPNLMMGGNPTSSTTVSVASGRLSRHSSTSSLVGSPTAAASASFDLELLAAKLKANNNGSNNESKSTSKTPAPFPISTQIGVASLSRQNSLRRSASKDASCVSKLVVSSSSSSSSSSALTSPSAPSSTKMLKKPLVTTRSTPLMNLSGIHEEEQVKEESNQTEDNRKEEQDRKEDDGLKEVVSEAIRSDKGSAVVRRLELRRRKLQRSHQQSASSSEASSEADDGEQRLRQGLMPLDDTCTAAADTGKKRRDAHEDSSDSQADSQPPKAVDLSQSATKTAKTTSESKQGATTTSTTRTRGGSQRGQGQTRAHSLNRISELQEVGDFSIVIEDKADESGPLKVVSSESDSDTQQAFDLLNRYLDSIDKNQGERRVRSSARAMARDDSQNSSDNELEADVYRQSHCSRRMQHKQTKTSSGSRRAMELRLNKIQEENSSPRHSDQSEDDEVEDDDDDDDEDVDHERRSMCSSDEERQSSLPPDDEVGDVVECLRNTLNKSHVLWTNRVSDVDETMSTKSCDTHLCCRRMSQLLLYNSRRSSLKRPLARAHSCGSLMGLKERALMHVNMVDHLLMATASSKNNENNKEDKERHENVVNATAIVKRLAVVPWTPTSRCCNLC